MSRYSILVKEKTFGPLTLKLLKNEHDDYCVAYYSGDRMLGSYEHEHLDQAEQDWNTLYHGFRDMLEAVKQSLGG
jgi:hypothetical protein